MATMMPKTVIVDQVFGDLLRRLNPVNSWTIRHDKIPLIEMNLAKVYERQRVLYSS